MSTASNVDIKIPKSLEQALQWLADPDTHVIAGGTDLMVLKEAGRLTPGVYISIWGLNELEGIQRQSDGSLRIGALVTHRQLALQADVVNHAPILAEAARLVGAIAIQNRGTIGGNLANASPAGDLAPVLMVLDATVETVSLEGTRTVPISEFFLSYRKTALRKDELIAAVLLPARPQNMRFYYRKVGPRRAQAISKIALAGVGVREGDTVSDVRFAAASLAPTTVRLQSVERFCNGRVLAPLLKDSRSTQALRQCVWDSIKPIDDLRSTSEYRKHITSRLVEEALESWI